MCTSRLCRSHREQTSSVCSAYPASTMQERYRDRRRTRAAVQDRGRYLRPAAVLASPLLYAAVGYLLARLWDRGVMQEGVRQAC
jgi:hypothetical protein